MDAILLCPKFLFQVVIWGCAAQYDIADCGTVAGGSGFFGYQASQQIVWLYNSTFKAPGTLLDALLASENCAQSVKKGEQETKMLSTKKV